MGSQFPNQELNPGPLQWKCRVLTAAFSTGPEPCFCRSRDQQREDQPVFLTILLHTCLSHAVLAATSRLASNSHILGVWRCIVTIFVADLVHQVLVLFLQFCSLFMRRFWAFLVADSKESACNAGNLGSVFGLGRSPGERDGNPLQHSCLENSMDGTWWAMVHGVAKSQTRLRD